VSHHYPPKQLHWQPISKLTEEKSLKITFKSQNGLRPSYLLDMRNMKVQSRSLRSADGHSLVSRLFNCVRSLTNLLVQSDLDCGMTFHNLHVMAHKSAPMPTTAPHSLLSFVLIWRPLITPVSYLPRLFYKLLLWCGMSVIPCVPKALRAMRTL